MKCIVTGSDPSTTRPQDAAWTRRVEAEGDVEVVVAFAFIVGVASAVDAGLAATGDLVWVITPVEHDVDGHATRTRVDEFVVPPVELLDVVREQLAEREARRVVITAPGGDA
jgi:hypothetical protein